ncbi:MAG: 3-isopropylmalate dehydratase small subunit [Candidatus Thermoplasmatota archaeon]|nr:3-isopropylmalate dehydratase small subunit [Candidatus Thermoplasmatota archaeon]
MTSEGRVWKFGDDVNTDMIIPGRYLDRYDPKHLASHAMEGADKDFASKVRPDDIVIAGKNFGCGSSREQAVVALKESGVSAVIAKSFARIFYRNAINLGLLVIASDSAAEVFKDGDMVAVDLGGSAVRSKDGTKMAPLHKPPERAMAILRAGGLIPYIKSSLGREVG